MFGAMKAGAIAVPLFTLFGPDGVRLRVQDCTPKHADHQAGKGVDARGHRRPAARGLRCRAVRALREFPATYSVATKADSLAVFQYTSGTTRELPEAVRHTHRTLVTLMVAALYGTGIRPGDRFICPSSPAWGHGLWHGTLAPLALGLTSAHIRGSSTRETAAGVARPPVHQYVGGSDTLPDDA